MKILLKLVVVALLANALWHVSMAYMTSYRFKDAVLGAALQEGITEDELRQKVVDLAGTYSVPLTAEGVTIGQEEHHTTVEGSYALPVAVVPGYEYRWPFTMSVDAYVVTPPVRRGDLIKP